MTLLFIDGFDAQDTKQKYAANGDFVYAFPQGRYGQGCGMKLTNTVTGSLGTNQVGITRSFTPSTQVWAGFAVTPGGIQTRIGFLADSGATQHIFLLIGTDGSLALQRGTTSVATAPAGTVSGWAYVEITATINGSTGIAQCYVNGTQVMSFTGNTKNGGTSTSIDAVGIGTGGASLNTTSGNLAPIDDLYVLNTSGSTNNARLGEVVVQTVRPVGPGQYAGLASSTVLSNWNNEDDVYSAANYNFSATSGDKDSYALGDVDANSSTIYGVQLNMIADKVGGTTAGFKGKWRSGGTDYTDATSPLTASPTTYSTVREQDPATSAAWTISGVNALEVGAEVA